MQDDASELAPRTPYEASWIEEEDGTGTLGVMRLPEPLAMKRLLVPLDGSPYAERAVPSVAALASATGAQVVLAHVSTPRSSPKVAARPQGTGGRHEDMPHGRDLPTYLERLHTALRAYVPDVAVQQVQASTAAQGLLSLEKEMCADVVVMASHARQGAGRLILGSVADELVRLGRAPVLIVPPRAPQLKNGLSRWSRVVVALDGSALAEQALGPVLGWLGGDPPSELAPRDLLLLAVVEHHALLDHARHYLDQVREPLVPRLPAVAVSTSSRVGDPGALIVEAGEVGELDTSGRWQHADVIVMATHGRSGLARYLYGSVASYVLAHATVPVLLVHPAADTL